MNGLSLKELPLRTLGRSGLRVTPIGLGGAWLGLTGNGYDDDIATDAVHRALNAGINLIDTSPLYGESERRIGAALQNWYGPGRQRSDFILSTKTGTRTRPYEYSGDATLRSIDESLRLLKTDYLDIVHIHDPSDLAPVLAPGGALETLQKLKEQKIIRAIGLGVRSHAFHQRLIETGALDVSLTYRDFNLVDQSAASGVLTHAAERHVGVLNAMVVIGGLLGGDDPIEVARQSGTPGKSVYKHDDREVRRARQCWEFANAHGINLLALNLQFCMREERISSTLLGVASSRELDQDLMAIQEPISAEIWDELAELLE